MSYTASPPTWHAHKSRWGATCTSKTDPYAALATPTALNLSRSITATPFEPHATYAAVLERAMACASPWKRRLAVRIVGRRGSVKSTTTSMPESHATYAYRSWRICTALARKDVPPTMRGSVEVHVWVRVSKKHRPMRLHATTATVAVSATPTAGTANCPAT
ncbi:hypothetical protein H257_01420 [Aphanomyces astaci]|uniref:Uncharacterized protein n=1 Tax=Aphanomyces astaci TaxID=112090 RepID=W4HAE3_APHAT|nr:hypothetical protein H257_01420 [Aphanomyces astaci]ETV88048.1 hypothetical protein H257_01420 [Aphanomyces astaci]|eukprot:XP_009822911.1 hypothetical protein H257_01420 [Aphanomyces astaci]